jgi:hypothetical protein
MLKALDRRVVAGSSIGVLIMLMLFISFVRPAASEHDAAISEEKRMVEEVGNLRTRLSEISENGTSSIDALVAKIRAIEIALPTEIDDLTLASSLSASSRSAGIDLNEFTITSRTPIKSGALEYVEYTMSVTGSSTDVLGWMENVQRSTSFVITFANLTLSPSSKSSDVKPDATTGNITMQGLVRVWLLDGKRVVAVELNENDLDPSPTTSPEPSDN